MKRPDDALDRVATWLGRDITARQRKQLDDYASWLVDEALVLGGIGPEESTRIWDRHILDSLLFAHDLATGDSVLDIGSGVGLPGIPVAIVHDGPVILLDRAGRRVDALRRIQSVLELGVTIVQGDAGTYDRSDADRVLFRASLPLSEARQRLADLCAPGGSATFGLGRGEAPDAVTAWRATEPPSTVAESLIYVPSGVLDSPAWLLRMTPL